MLRPELHMEGWAHKNNGDIPAARDLQCRGLQGDVLSCRSWLCSGKGMVLPPHFCWADCHHPLLPGCCSGVEGSSGTRAVTSLLHWSVPQVSHFLFSQPYAGSALHRQGLVTDMAELCHPLCLAWSTQCHDACAYLFLRAGPPSLFQQRAGVSPGLQPRFPLRSSE